MVVGEDLVPVEFSEFSSPGAIHARNRFPGSGSSGFQLGPVGLRFRRRRGGSPR